MRATPVTRTAAKRPAPKRPPKRVLNVVPSKRMEDDWMFEHAAAAGLVRAPTRRPAGVDLRESWWKIADQGQTGSCVGWATADSVLRWIYVKTGRITTTALLSPRFIWMAAKETDEFTSQPTTFIENDGTSLKAALDVARKFGVVQERLLPFGSGKLYPQPAKTFYAEAAKLKIRSYFNLGRKLPNWRSWLVSNGPILARVEVDDTWYSGGDGGHLEEYRARTAAGGHAVAIVGFNATSFIVRNSWGTSWGDRGYAYASWAYAEAGFTEAYGVTV